MKKLLTLVVAVVMSVCAAYAQTPVKYHGEIDLGYGIGTGAYGQSRASLHTIQGAKLGDHFSTGLGLGLDFYPETERVDMIIPVYVNLKGYIPVGEIFNLYASFDLGYGIGATNDVAGLSGLYCCPAIGLQADIFKVQLGYNIQQQVRGSGLAMNMEAIQIKVGIVF